MASMVIELDAARFVYAAWKEEEERKGEKKQIAPFRIIDISPVGS